MLASMKSNRYMYVIKIHKKNKSTPQTEFSLSKFEKFMAGLLIFEIMKIVYAVRAKTTTNFVSCCL